jgi:hypothetical protein
VCDDPVCEAVCEPECTVPKCATVYKNIPNSTVPGEVTKCATECEKQYQDNSCPVYETQCIRPKCSEDVCQIVCEIPECRYVCKKPAKCREPKCELVCEKSACEADEEFIKQLKKPPTRSSGHAVYPAISLAAALFACAFF